MRINRFISLLACAVAASPCVAGTMEASVQGHDAAPLPATYTDAGTIVFANAMLFGEEPMPAASTEASDTGIGIPVDAGELERLRGGESTVDNDVLIDGTVEGNTADHIVSGANAISDGAFTNANGINTVIQNSGSNVLIQNGMVVNVQFVAPPSP
ncbi:hypothetical protein [Pseudoxanthomonas sacheonensis]|uniref:Uncharacterized protein n=1 Tax=Pseudoxanthomonas sacheonensis TaxID=443615 RepID=A0ABU1RPS2_9GAMM|nr:hypothetical protein [Pseudoxanthomonas sacheonensis]MDR6840757.1 hypothetical protein [Pseudoxanthomonas sacheonensis]